MDDSSWQSYTEPTDWGAAEGDASHTPVWYCQAWEAYYPSPVPVWDGDAWTQDWSSWLLPWSPWFQQPHAPLWTHGPQEEEEEAEQEEEEAQLPAEEEPRRKPLRGTVRAAGAHRKAFVAAASAGTASAAKLPYRQPRGAAAIPTVVVGARHPGSLLHALAFRGVAFVNLGVEAKSVVGFDKWSGLFEEVHKHPKRFKSRDCVQQRQLRLSRNEDLRRTLDGSEKEHVPDNRSMFGVSDSAMYTFCRWEEYRWVLESYETLKAALVSAIELDVIKLFPGERTKPRTLGGKVLRHNENWSQSALRHCFYPSGGSCTEHSDYGFVTVQFSNTPGFEAYLDGEWCPIHPPEGLALLFAGDMLERASNGTTTALLHRVSVSPSKKQEVDRCKTVRQSHILFLQPDVDTLVCPFNTFLDDESTDLHTIRYGDWHRKKVNLAFGKPPYPLVHRGR